MERERWKRIDELYHSARQRPPGEQDTFLREACGGDESLRHEVESLLGCRPEAGVFIESPAIEMAAGTLVQDKAHDRSVDLSGQSLLHYGITQKIGEGGMGVVYKAHDTHLDRTVAIKVLPAGMVADRDRKRRFVQEARAASALNHPNIVTIYDIASDGGIDFISMEYVAGKTLSSLIPRSGMRPIPTLKIAMQLADGLSKAHAAGIVHRDLKPSNIMVTEDGLVKILDFGLAKLLDRPAGGSEETKTSQEGMIVGTVAYMSPEQAEGKPVDRRSDIFSFGSVLYEMVTGRRAFEGDTPSSTLVSVIKEDPKPPSTWVPEIPRNLERVIQRCLRKDPLHRWQHLDDIKVELEELKEESDAGKAKPVAAPKRRRRWACVAGVLAFTLAAAGWLWFGRSRVLPPETVIPLTSFPGMEITPSFSPDGNQVAFAWNGENESNYDIYVQMIGSGGPLRRTTDPADDFSPAWSPDGKQIAFLRHLGSRRLAVTLMPSVSGAEQKLTEVRSGIAYAAGYETLAWHPGGKHLVIADAGALFLLSTETGDMRRLTTPPPARAHLNPAFSPDGRKLAFIQFSGYASDLYILPLDDRIAPQGEPTQLVKGMDPSFPVWTADGREIVISGGPVLAPNLWRIAVAGPGKPQRLAWGGEEGGINPALSRDGHRLVYARFAWDLNIYRLELSARGTADRPPTRHIVSSRNEAHPELSPDGSKMVFASDRSGTTEIWVSERDGSNPVRVTSFGGPLTGSPLWSPDGREIAFDSRPEGHSDIFIVGAGGPGKPRRLTANPAQDMTPSWSRDGKWIHFVSNRTGSNQVWKMPAAGSSVAEAPVQVTLNRGSHPSESLDGKLLYYFKEYAVWQVPVIGGKETEVFEPIDAGSSFAVADRGLYFIPRGERAVRFFDFRSKSIHPVATLGPSRFSDLSVSRDGRTILFAQSDSSVSDLMLVENFR